MSVVTLIKVEEGNPGVPDLVLVICPQDQTTGTANAYCIIKGMTSPVRNN